VSATLPPWTANAEPAGIGDDSAFLRLWRGFMTARVSVALVLTLLLAAMFSLGPAHASGSWLVGLCVAYLAAAVAVRAFSMPAAPGQSFDPQWVSSIGIDLLAFSTLQFLQAGGLNYAPLFALPVLMAAVLGSALLALGTAAGVTLLLLVDAWLQALDAAGGDWAARFLQAGLTGIGYFVVALLANQLAARLAREERVARRNQLAARMQAQVNAMVIESMDDGVLVVDGHGEVQASNPAARQLLGAPPDAPLLLPAHAAWQPLAGLARATIGEGLPRTAEIALMHASGERRLVHVRTQPTPAQAGQAAPLCVMFLQDLREMEARLRTEKLAAMGRMSAAVAHEIRNPLAAIAQANELLGEELAEPTQKQLSDLVRHNAQRLSHIVEEILDIVRVQQQGTPPARCELAAEAARICGEWARAAAAGARLRVDLGGGEAQVMFDAEHLRRVLVNLLDNALRYAGHQPDSIRVTTESGPRGTALRVWSDGAPIEQGVQRHLFEPFFSSESRSSGLGLYICRELCERHGAAIVYRRAAAVPGGRDGNEFFVSFRTAAATAAPAGLGTIGA
jgi:two-component system sensor histidine kinase PilS (NtrC family)